MTLTPLRYVITVAETKSKNEQQSNKGVFMTSEGEEFIGYAKQVVGQYSLIETKYVNKENVKKKLEVMTIEYLSRKRLMISSLGQKYIKELSKYKDRALR